MMETEVLTPADIAHFETWGYVRVQEAFPRDRALAMQEFMWKQMKSLHGVDRHDRATWACPWLAAGLNKTGGDPVYAPVAAPRLTGAIDALLGAGAWRRPKSWGGFLVSFPPLEPSVWFLPASGWHWDTDAAIHLGGVQGLFVFTFYSWVAPRGGGTLTVAGSPRLIDRYFAGLTPEQRAWKHRRKIEGFPRTDLWLAELAGGGSGWMVRRDGDDAPERLARFLKTDTDIEGVPVRVVELTGEPGDAVLCHPSILHTVSPNRGCVPRFMRVKGVGKAGEGEDWWQR